MKLIIIRHGETEGNVNDIVQGQQPGKLTKNGKEQAKKLAIRLKNEKIDVIYSSDLKRAYDTAKEIAKFHSSIIKSKELRERNYGIFEGKKKSEIKEHVRGFGEHWDIDPEKGESLENLKARAGKIIEKIIKKHKGKTVLIVAHGTFNKMLISYLLKKSIEEGFKQKQKNTCVNIIEIKENGNHKAELLNCYKHL